MGVANQRMSREKLRMRNALTAVLLIVLTPWMAAQQPLDNSAIIKMVKAGLSAEIVIATVNSQPGRYDVSPDALIALKKAGASDAVISTLIGHNSSANNNAAASAGTPAAPEAWTVAGGGAESSAPAGNGLPPGVDSTGLYFQDKNGAWSEMNAEVVNFKTGGALKHIGSAGLVKGDLNGNVAGFHSHLALQPPASFLIHTPDGVSPGEYQLVRFRLSAEAREFRALTGGVAHASGGATRDVVDFSTKKIAPHVYLVTVSADAGKGEYGFLPPMDAAGGKNLANSGKIYTFSFEE
jgi:hypothetical protein